MPQLGCCQWRSSHRLPSFNCAQDAPFGGLRASFTGQRSEEATLGSLYDYNARFYSLLGRFLSPDSIVPRPGNPSHGDFLRSQSLNRYAYVLNNPLRYTDPTGHWAESAFDVISLGLTLNDIRNEGFTLGNTVALITDAASVALPIVPAGVSHALRALKLANKAVNVADIAGDAAKAVAKVEDVRHARSSAEVAQSVLRKIDPGRFNPGARFGKAFYVAQEGGTAVAEIAAHGGEASHVIRYQADLSKAKVLDLTNTDIAQAWGYVEDAGAYSAHQDLARRAMEQGYNAIKYNSYRGPGFNYAFLDNPLNPFDLDAWLIPQMIRPVP